MKVILPSVNKPPTVANALAPCLLRRFHADQVSAAAINKAAAPSSEWEKEIP
jgi:hypothetical protein